MGEDQSAGLKKYTEPKFRYEYRYVNGLMLHVGCLGPADGEKIFFLHGFPEFSQSWIKQAAFFARIGYHVIAPDQRGYNLSKKPGLVKDYALSNLANDTAALILSFTSRPVAIAGHDWGGGVAWALAQDHPHLVKKLIILNMPHLQVMRENLRSSPKQMLKSWYTGLFQIPSLPELLCSAFNYKWLVSSLVGSARPGTFSKADIAAYKKAWQQPNAMQAMINWYRAFFRVPFQTDFDIQAEVLLLWGARDMFLSRRMADQSIARCPRGQLIVLEAATHWLHHEEPLLVNEHILAFLNRQLPGDS